MVVKSELFRNEEFNQAIELGRSLGVEVLETEMAELEDDNIVKNTPKAGISVNDFFMENLMKSKRNSTLIIS